MQQTHSDSLIYLQEAVDLELASNEYTEQKKICWINLGQEYEIEGIPKHEIGKKMQSSIESKIEQKTGLKVSVANGHWYRTINSHQWGIRTGKIEEENALGRKTDSTLEETEVEEPVKKEKPVIIPAVENAPIIEMLEKRIVADRKLINYAKINPVASLIPPEVVEDIITRDNAMTENLRDFINKKQNIPTHAQSIILLVHFSSLGIHDLFFKFYGKLKDIHMADLQQRMDAPLHKKEMRKFLMREVITLDHTLEFPDASTARLYGFYGQQCSHCKGFRTKVHPEKAAYVYCIKCAPTLGLDKRRTLKQCEKCQSDIDPGDVAKATIKRCASCQ